MSALQVLALLPLLLFPADAPKQDAAPPAPAQQVQRVRPICPIRLGGVYTLGLGENGSDFEESATSGTKLSADNQKWIAANCDLIALNAVNITPEMYAYFYKAQLGFTPLLYVSASALYEQPERKGNIGGWKPEMTGWTLRDKQGKEVPHPIKGGHWMDFGNKDWATYWKERTTALVRQYQAQGVVAAQLPMTNNFIGDSFANSKYKTSADLIDATGSWLKSVRAEGQYVMIPSALGFDEIAGHPTLATPAGTEREKLVGRLWDAFYSGMDGAWVEGWVHPYWSAAPLSEDLWEIQIEAADRYSRQGNVFIAAAAYHNDAELEFALASYLMAYHRQGRLVFQPMPLLPDERPDAGFSLALLRKQVSEKARYFNVPLGPASQERHLIPVEGGMVWRRAFENGVVYLNSNDIYSRKVLLGGEMERLSGERVRGVELPPHSAAILLYINETKTR